MKNLEIRKITRLEHKQFKAKVDVVFKVPYWGNVVIKGFRVGNSKYQEPWVQPPSYQMYGVYKGIVFLEKSGKWEEFKTFLVGACLEKGITLNTQELNENVSPEEVRYCQVNCVTRSFPSTEQNQCLVGTVSST